MSLCGVQIFQGLQNPVPDGLTHWYEVRVDRTIAVSVDSSYTCTNDHPVPDHKIFVFEDGARWSEIREGFVKVRCRIVSPEEA